MPKIGIIKKKSFEVNGIIDIENLAVEVNGETLLLENLLKDFDGYDIKILITKEDSNENPTNEDIGEDLNKF